MLRPMKVGDETCIIHHINKVGKKKEKKERRREVCRRFRFWCLVGRVAERGQMSGKEKKKKSRDCTRPSAQSRHLPGFLYSN